VQKHRALSLGLPRLSKGGRTASIFIKIKTWNVAFHGVLKEEGTFFITSSELL